MYSFPDNDQQQVPVPSPVVLRFSSPVETSFPSITLREAGGPIVEDYETEWVDGKRGLILTPDTNLEPLTEYLIQIPAVELKDGLAPATDLRFSTRALQEGPKSQVAQGAFEMARMIPDGENYPVMDFSSFRMQFSQPLDPASVKYGGDNATVRLTGPEGLVEAHLLVSGHYMTIDPKDELTPGAAYSLTMTSGVTSMYGETLPPVNLGVSPRDTRSPELGLRESLVQEVANTEEPSMLTGMPINLVPMQSVLLGDDTATQASGMIAAELAYGPNFPNQTPFRIKRGSLIDGEPIKVLIGGKVPAGFESGGVRMDFLSDATGYLLSNRYSDADNAPRHVRLWMDVAVTTSEPQANGAITQDLLHIELAGTALVENDELVIDAVGVVEPEVLGSEYAAGVLSFYMKGREDLDHSTVIADAVPLKIQSWSPGENLKGFLPSDPAIIRFSKPVAMDDIQNLITVRENGQPIDVAIEARGSSLVITPEQGFKRSVQTSFDGANNVDRYEYTIEVAGGVSDMLGTHQLTTTESFEFELPVEVTLAEQYQWWGDAHTMGVLLGPEDADVTVRSPMITSVYPGYPCALADTTVDLASGMTAHCRGGLEEIYHRVHHLLLPDNAGAQVQHLAHKLPDDILPLTSLPANRPIIAVFTKPVAAESVALGGSFKVETVDQWGNVLEQVPGQVSIDSRKVTFWPAEPWEADTFYRYVLGSNGDRHSSTAACDGSQAICSVDGLPIQTQLHEITPTQLAGLDGSMHDLLLQDANAPDGGGVDLVQYFKGAEATAQVLQVLNAPSVDTNANLMHDRNSDNRLDLAVRPYNYTNALFYNTYSVEEDGAQNQPRLADPCNADDPNCYDPDGLVPPWNSAKILPGILQPADEEGEVCDPADPNCRDLPYCDITNRYCHYTIPIVNVGCDVEVHVGFDYSGRFVMETCPEDKFTYITSDLIAEVGEYDATLGGVPVTIWPGQIMATSLAMTSPLQMGFTFGFDSGPQVMRMRYAKRVDDCEESAQDETVCTRDQPIQAVITERVGEDGKSYPHISTVLDIYVDAIDLQANIHALIDIINQSDMDGTVTSDMMSVPATLQLEGKVHFNDDGTMRVEMENVSRVNLDMGIKVVTPLTPEMSVSMPFSWTTLKIPEGGTRVQYLSEIIK